MKEPVAIVGVQEAALEESVSAAVDFAKSIEIHTEQDFKYAGEALRMVKERRKVADTVFDASIKSAHKAHKEVVALKKKITTPLDDAEGIVKKKISGYVIVQEKKHDKVQAKAEEGIIVPFELPVVEGISYRRKWQADIQDSSKLNPEYLAPDLKKIKAITEALGARAPQALGEPGAVRVWLDTTVAVRTI